MKKTINAVLIIGIFLLLQSISSGYIYDSYGASINQTYHSIAQQEAENDEARKVINKGECRQYHAGQYNSRTSGANLPLCPPIIGTDIQETFLSNYKNMQEDSGMIGVFAAVGLTLLLTGLIAILRELIKLLLIRYKGKFGGKQKQYLNLWIVLLLIGLGILFQTVISSIILSKCEVSRSSYKFLVNEWQETTFGKLGGMPIEGEYGKCRAELLSKSQTYSYIISILLILLLLNASGLTHYFNPKNKPTIK